MMFDLKQIFGPGGELIGTILPFVMIAAVFYFLLIRPQQKQAKKHADLIASLKRGDEVILSSGIVGRIFAVEDRFITLEIGDKAKLKVARQAVQGLMGSSSNLAAADENK